MFRKFKHRTQKVQCKQATADHNKKPMLNIYLLLKDTLLKRKVLNGGKFYDK